MDPTTTLRDMADQFAGYAGSARRKARLATPGRGRLLEREARTWQAAAAWCRDAANGTAVEIVERPAVPAGE